MPHAGELHRETVEQEVLAIVGQLLAELGGRRRDGVGLDDSLDRDLGIGSLERVELLLRLEKALGVRLPDAVMAEAETVRHVVDAILAGQPSVPEPIPERPAAPGEAIPAPESIQTLTDVLRWRATTDPERVHIFLRGDDGREEPISYGRLWERASAVAAGLSERGLERRDSVAIMLRTEEAFFPAFFGTLLAGGVPVPIYPPFRLERIEEYALRQIGILKNAEARWLITFSEAERLAGLLRSRVPSLREVTVVDRLARPGAEAPPVRLAPGDPAVIQYTSGSTGDPKGVLLSHANILANIRAIGEAVQIRPGDVEVSWLPLYHDMGLIGAWLGALYLGIPVVLLSPLAFLSRPARWLWAIHAHRGTLSAAPNFAFDLCARAITDEEIRGLDLGSWRLAFNGAEAVTPDTIERFTRRFASCGFRPEAMCPAYGLAEASVALTVSPLGRPPRVDRIARDPFQRSRQAVPAGPDEPNPLRLVSCGRPLPGHDVRIVDADGKPAGERVEGRVEFSGPSVTAGYFRNPEATRTAVRDGWMDSGDLGYQAGGELFITGRQKDIIIKGGRNLHPDEAEDVVGNIAGIRRGCVAAFGVSDPAIGTERLVIVAESQAPAPENREALAAAVLDRVVHAIGIPPDAVVIAGPDSIPKTPSGKVRRSATRDAYVRGELGARPPSTPIQLTRLVFEDLAARIGRLIGHGRALAYAAYLAVILALTLPPLWGLVLLAPSARAVDRLVRTWCRVVLALAGCPIRVEGLPNLRDAGPAVLACNHASYLDSVALLASLPVEFGFVAKRELTALPLVGAVIRKAGHLTVDRVDLSRSAADAERAAETLRGGTSLLFFPEGTFVRAPGLLPFRLGSFKAAVDAGRPVIPLAIRGTREIFPADTWLLRRGAITVKIGAPIMPEGTGWPEMARLRDLTRAEIARLSGEHPVEAQP